MTSPPRGYSWPPFEPGNVAAVRHCTFSSRKVVQVAETLRPTLSGHWRRARGSRTSTAPKSMPPLGCRTRHRGTGDPRCRDRPPGDPPSRRPPHQPLTAREAPGTPRPRPNAQFPHNRFTWLVPTTDSPEEGGVFGTCQSLAGHWLRLCADPSTPPSFVAGTTDPRTTSHDPPFTTRRTRSGPYDSHAVRVRVHVDAGRGRCDPTRG